MKPRIVGLGGSLRTPSSSLAALRLALSAAADAGAHVELLDIRDLRLPLYGTAGEGTGGAGTAGEGTGGADREGPGVPPGAERLAGVVGGADGMIWSSPLYHGTVSAAFKNALDWLQVLSGREPPFLTDLPIGLIATAAGSHGLQAINTMEYVVRALRGWAVPYVVPIAHSHDKFTEDGTPRDAAVSQQLAKLGREVVAAAQRFAHVPEAV